METLRIRLKFDSCFAVNKSGMSGGLALLWKEDVQVMVSTFTKNHVAAIMQ